LLLSALVAGNLSAQLQPISCMYRINPTLYFVRSPMQQSHNGILCILLAEMGSHVTFFD